MGFWRGAAAETHSAPSRVRGSTSQSHEQRGDSRIQCNIVTLSHQLSSRSIRGLRRNKYTQLKQETHVMQAPSERTHIHPVAAGNSTSAKADRDDARTVRTSTCDRQERVARHVRCFARRRNAWGASRRLGTHPAIASLRSSWPQLAIDARNTRVQESCTVPGGGHGVRQALARSSQEVRSERFCVRCRNAWGASQGLGTRPAIASLRRSWPHLAIDNRNTCMHDSRAVVRGGDELWKVFARTSQEIIMERFCAEHACADDAGRWIQHGRVTDEAHGHMRAYARGYLMRIIIIPAVYRRLAGCQHHNIQNTWRKVHCVTCCFEVQHFDIQSTGQNSYGGNSCGGHRNMSLELNSRIPLVRSSFALVVYCTR